MDERGFGLPTHANIANIPQNYPYNSSIASSASSSSSSVFSSDNVSVQSATTASSTSSANDAVWRSSDASQQVREHHAARQATTAIKLDAPVAPELRQNPRRTSQDKGGLACHRPPPLVRQNERKVNFVDNLVGELIIYTMRPFPRLLFSSESATQIVEAIWPLSVVACRGEGSGSGKGVLPLRTFIQETLRRSRTSYSTLQVALYYLILIKEHVPKHDFTMEQPRDDQASRALQCGRRMFLAALILASKYLQDRNYSARAWSKISGLPTCEINANELMFLSSVGWNMHIRDDIFQKWADIVIKYSTIAGTGNFALDCNKAQCWKTVISRLTPGLSEVDSSTSIRAPQPDMSSVMDLSNLTSCPKKDRRRIESTSQEQTPTRASIPLTLEPTPRASESESQALPPLPRIGFLPTPQMTPQSSSNVNTPAVSVNGFCPRRPSICSAMSIAQNACMSRTTLDQRPPPPCFRAGSGVFPPSARRSSVAPSSSSASSPESMISDISSVSSRSSSISSVASSNCAPVQPRLAVQATRRCANMQNAGSRENSRGYQYAPAMTGITYPEFVAANCPFKDGKLSKQTFEPFIPRSGGEDSHATFTSSPLSVASSVPDLSGMALRTPSPPEGSQSGQRHTAILSESDEEAARNLCELSIPRPMSQTYSNVRSTRAPKRSRAPSTTDQALQREVREHLASNRYTEDDGMVLADPSVADSKIVLPPLDKGLQSPSSSRMSACRVPVQKDSGRKRTACSFEAAMGHRLPGPGMWQNILD